MAGINRCVKEFEGALQERGIRRSRVARQTIEVPLPFSFNPAGHARNLVETIRDVAEFVARRNSASFELMTSNHVKVRFAGA